VIAMGHTMERHIFHPLNSPEKSSQKMHLFCGIRRDCLGGFGRILVAPVLSFRFVAPQQPKSA
jgi:hypothetical protein